MKQLEKGEKKVAFQIIDFPHCCFGQAQSAALYWLFLALKTIDNNGKSKLLGFLATTLFFLF